MYTICDTLSRGVCPLRSDSYKSQGIKGVVQVLSLRLEEVVELLSGEFFNSGTASTGEDLPASDPVKALITGFLRLFFPFVAFAFFSAVIV